MTKQDSDSLGIHLLQKVMVYSLWRPFLTPPHRIRAKLKKRLRQILDPGGWRRVRQLEIAGTWLVQRQSPGDLSTKPAGPEY